MEPKREDRDRPLLEVAKRGEKATSAQTFGNIVVCMLGPGVLGLPYAFQVAGWLAGSVGLLSTALVTYYCMLLLVSHIHFCYLTSNIVSSVVVEIS